MQNQFEKQMNSLLNCIETKPSLSATSLNRKLTCERSEFGKRGMGPLDEVIHQISIGCDMQFQRKVRRKIFTQKFLRSR